jgi:hypothetical protein
MLALLLACRHAVPPSPAAVDSAELLLAGLPEGAADPPETLRNEMSGEEYGRRFSLNQSIEIAGLTCQADGGLELYEDSWSCTLAAEATLGDLTLPAGTDINPYYTGGLRLLYAAWSGAEVLSVGAARCRGVAVLWPDGGLSRCELDAPLTVGGHTFAAETMLWLTEQGAPKEAMFITPHTFNGQVYAPGAVEFAADGSVQSHSPDYFGD